jgi:hypothetical protein
MKGEAFRLKKILKILILKDLKDLKRKNININKNKEQ